MCVAFIPEFSELKRKGVLNGSHVFFIRIFNRSLLPLTFSRIWKMYVTEEKLFSSSPYFFINIVNQMIHNPIEGYYIYANKIMYTIVNSIYVNLICFYAWESLSRYDFFFWWITWTSYRFKNILVSGQLMKITFFVFFFLTLFHTSSIKITRSYHLFIWLE